MPDGTAEAAFFYKKGKPNAGVLLWADAFGLRPWTRQMGARLAAAGYSVLVPNPFYRVSKSPVFGDISHFSFSNPADRNKLTPLMGSIGADGAAERDAVAFVAGSWIR